ncbi:hypothetical protein CHARACLAT_020871 [Characodon lateralis]|uniref:Uncharacterized protein n=1 Tax=Characodon lateralis TaxID=208331 RepID=A0ABU7CSZ1_9TELE|nr:hypothetical protein [Characodon lateralis]
MGGGVYLCVFERGRERGGKNVDIFLPSLYASSQIMPQYSQTPERKAPAMRVMFKAPLPGKPVLFALCPLFGAPSIMFEDICVSWLWILQNWAKKEPYGDLISVRLDIICAHLMISALVLLIFERGGAWWNWNAEERDTVACTG